MTGLPVAAPPWSGTAPPWDAPGAGASVASDGGAQPAAPLPTVTVTGVLSADVVVVGAGLAGLSTAYHLVQRSPGLDVAVVDAAGPAAGASGHGTGLLGPRVGPTIDRAVRAYGPSLARKMHVASEEAVSLAVALCGELQVPFRAGGQIVAARSAGGLASLARQARAYRALALDVPLLGADGIRSRVDVPYQAGLFHRSAVTLDPASLTGALARACADKGVRLYGNSALLARRAGVDGGTELVFPQGVFRTPRTVIAVNADTAVIGPDVGTVLPLQVHAIATRPLDGALLDALGRISGTSLIGAVPLSAYFRLTPDGRLVLGGGPALHTQGLPAERHSVLTGRAWRTLEKRLRTLHPGLARVEVTHRWSGRIGMTADDLPVVGRVGGSADTFWIGGCCGHGLAMSVAHGAHVAGRLLGGPLPGEPMPWHRDRAPKLPLPAPVRAGLRLHLDRLARTAQRADRA